MSRLLPVAIEFQSDARRIDEQRPHWVARATLYSLLMLIVTAVAWASIATIDRIVVAPGKLITTAPTIVVQPLETSIVRTLEAKVGDTLRKGDVLATLDPTFTEADSAQLTDKVASLDAKIERLGAQLEDRAYQPSRLNDEARLQSVIWIRSVQEHVARLDAYEQQIRHTDAEIETKDADYKELVPRLTIARELEGMRSELFRLKVGSKINLLDAEAQRLEVERNMQLALDTRVELEKELKRLVSEKDAYVAEYRRKLAEDLVAARLDRDGAAKQLEKAAKREAVTQLVAPADAIVLEVADRSVGSVVKEAETLYTLVPLDSPLEADVSVEDRDIGRVATGASVRLKLDAWPFQRHGTLDGRLRTVSQDSFVPDSKKDATQQKPYYKARIEITSRKLRDVPADFHLIPGMAVTAEIKAGDRSVLSYLLYPLMRGLDERLREP